MSRNLVESRIQDRTARGRLKVRNKPYWRFLSEGVHLGYRKGARKTTWMARYYCKHTDAYVTRALAEADDTLEADGHDVFDYKQAMDAALHWVGLRLEGADQEIVADPDMKVGQAVSAYIAMRDARRSTQAGREIKSDAHYKLTNHVLQDRIAGVKLAALAESDLRAWQLRTIGMPPGTRQRIINDFRAALNLAYETYRRVLPTDLPIVIKFGLKLDAPEILVAAARDNQILSDDEVRAIVTAAIAVEEDFGRLVVLLAATGARFSQLARMTVGDVQAEHSRLMIPQSLKGKKRVLQHVRVVVGSDTLAALAPILDRPRSAPLLERWRHKQVGPMKWERVDRGPWVTPSEMIRPWRVATEAAGLPAAIIPYALRHSSIVRGLRAGLPIRLVAALHDTSVAMIERHYSRWITEGLDELVARAVVPIVSMAA